MYKTRVRKVRIAIGHSTRETNKVFKLLNLKLYKSEII
jgi:hypothetical protein